MMMKTGMWIDFKGSVLKSAHKRRSMLKPLSIRFQSPLSLELIYEHDNCLSAVLFSIPLLTLKFSWSFLIYRTCLVPYIFYKVDNLSWKSAVAVQPSRSCRWQKIASVVVNKDQNKGKLFWKGVLWLDFRIQSVIKWNKYMDFLWTNKALAHFYSYIIKIFFNSKSTLTPRKSNWLEIDVNFK